MRPRHAIVLALATCPLLAAPPAAAQPNTLEPARLLAPGVYAVLQRLPARISDSNVLIVINDEDVVVVDANILPSSARKVVGEIRKLTNKPVRYVINTHWHSDHHYGNAAYREAYPGVEFIQHPSTRRDVLARDLPALGENVRTNYPAEAARLKRLLETGRTSQGDTLTPALRAAYTEMAAIYDRFVEDMSRTSLIPGTLVVQDSLVLHRGQRSIVVKYLGRGNTSGDLVVYLPKERVVATGDLVVSPVPFGYYSHLREWPTTLRTLRQVDAATIMPGHGPIMTDWSYLDQLIPLIESTWEQVNRAVAGGADLEATQRQVDLARFVDGFAGSDARQRQSFERNFQRPAVEAAFRELRPDTTRKN